MTTPFADAFAGRTVLVTGHTGFKGSWVSLWLSRLGADVVGFALPAATVPSLFEMAEISDVLVENLQGDVRDRSRLADVVRRTGPDLILHLAAQALVPEGYAQPVETFEVNVGGTVAVLDAVRERARPCAVVVITSDKCYANTNQVWGYRENDKLGGADPYSASKAAAELVTDAYRLSFFPPERVADHGVLVASARSGNVIGGGDWSAQRLVPDAVRALSDGRVLGLRNPGQTRPWQHVLEPLSGYLSLAAGMLDGDARSCGPWNFGPGPGEEVTVQALVEELFSWWGAGRWETLAGNDAAPESERLRLAIDKAASELGWRPCWDRTEMLRRTVEWYRRVQEGDGDARAACVEDIAAYERAMETRRS